MNQQTKWRYKTELNSVWKSYRWLLKEKLVAMDDNVRHMVDEMKLFRVPDDMIAEYLPRMFEELKAEIVAEQTEKYDDEGRERRRKRES